MTRLPSSWRSSRAIARLKTVVDTLAGAVIKRLTAGRRDSVAVIAEGLILGIDPADLQLLGDIERDAHDNLRLAEINIGELLQAAVIARLAEFGLSASFVAKNIGYELCCADPIPADMEYTRDLGCCAARYVMAGGTAADLDARRDSSCRCRSSDSSTPRRGAHGSGWWISTPPGIESLDGICSGFGG